MTAVLLTNGSVCRIYGTRWFRHRAARTLIRAGEAISSSDAR